MRGIYIPSNKAPTKCVGCSFRDPEYGGECILMPFSDFGTYEEQFERCPFKKLLEWFGSVPPHGDLIDRDALRAEVKKHATPSDALVFSLIRTSPTIIPADKEGE